MLVINSHGTRNGQFPCSPPITLPFSFISTSALKKQRGLWLSWRLRFLGTSTHCHIPDEPHAAFPHRAGKSLRVAGICYHPVKNLCTQAWPRTVENKLNNARSQELRLTSQRTDAQSKETLSSSLLLSHDQPLRLVREVLALRLAFSNRHWKNDITTPDTSQPLALNVFSCFIRRGRSVQLRSGQTRLSWKLWGRRSLLAIVLLPRSTWAETYLNWQSNTYCSPKMLLLFLLGIKTLVNMKAGR